MEAFIVRKITIFIRTIIVLLNLVFEKNKKILFLVFEKMM